MIRTERREIERLWLIIKLSFELINDPVLATSTSQLSAQVVVKFS